MTVDLIFIDVDPVGDKDVVNKIMQEYLQISNNDSIDEIYHGLPPEYIETKQLSFAQFVKRYAEDNNISLYKARKSLEDKHEYNIYLQRTPRQRLIARLKGDLVVYRARKVRYTKEYMEAKQEYEDAIRIQRPSATIKNLAATLEKKKVDYDKLPKINKIMTAIATKLKELQ